MRNDERIGIDAALGLSAGNDHSRVIAHLGTSLRVRRIRNGIAGNPESGRRGQDRGNQNEMRLHGSSTGGF